MEIVATDEFASWFRALGERDAEDVTRALNVLEAMGGDAPDLRRVEVPLPLARARPASAIHELAIRGTAFFVFLAMPSAPEPAVLLYGYASDAGRADLGRLAHLMLAVKVHGMHLAAGRKEAV
ncbi:MAG: hypothetical protein U0414_31385 [Polyangiaceae bacterium]